MTLAVAHVIVDQLPRPDANALAALTIARWALYVAAFTLLAVFAQICIAVSELKTVKRDFDLTQRQFKELTRRPKVTVGVGIQKPMVNIGSRFSAFFNLSNNGDKLSNSILLEVLIEAAHVDTAYTPLVGVSQSAIAVNKVTYLVLSYRLPLPLYPNGVISAFCFPTMSMRAEVQRSVILFRAYDENFAYPGDGYGSVEFVRDKPTGMVRIAPKADD